MTDGVTDNGTDSGGLRARVRYTEPMVRRAVRTYVWRSMRRLGWLWSLALAVLVLATTLSLWLGQPFSAGFGIAGLLLVPAFVANLWRAHFVNTVGRFRALDPPEADVTVGPDALAIRSSQGAVALPWGRFVAVWPLPDCWMLFLAPNQFMTLPTADLPPDMLATLRARLPKPGWPGLRGS